MRIRLATACMALAASSRPPAVAQDWNKIASDVLHQKLPGDRTNLSKG